MLLISHRGAKGLAPENTIGAIKIAANLGVKFIEFDIQKTKDNQAVIFHNRQTLVGKLVKEHTLKELQKLYPSAPTLTQALDACDSSLPLVELKSAGVAKIALPLLKAHSKACATSFLVDEISFLSSGLASNQLFLMQRKHPFGLVNKAASINAGGIGINKNWAILLPYFYWQAQHRGLTIYTYTVNSTFVANLLSRTMPQLLICTDYPDKLQKHSKILS